MAPAQVADDVDGMYASLSHGMRCIIKFLASNISDITLVDMQVAEEDENQEQILINEGMYCLLAAW